MTEEESVKRRHCYFSRVYVDTALGLGGIITLTPAQTAAKVLDKAV